MIIPYTLKLDYVIRKKFRVKNTAKKLDNKIFWDKNASRLGLISYIATKLFLFLFSK